MANNKIFRPGKTQRDRRSGAHARNIENKMTRMAWMHDPKRTNDPKSFPYHTCNGKKNKQVH